MSQQDQIDKLKKLPPLTQQVCATCAFFEEARPRWEDPHCHATQLKAWWTFEHRCRGRYWAPRQSVLTRFKRWLIG